MKGPTYVQNDALGFSDLFCPYCNGAVETEDADDLEVRDGGVMGTMRWYCEKCDTGDLLGFHAKLDWIEVDLDGEEAGGYTIKWDCPTASKNRARKPAARKATPKKAPAKSSTARKTTAARKPATRRKTAGARR